MEFYIGWDTEYGSDKIGRPTLSFQFYDAATLRGVYVDTWGDKIISNRDDVVVIQKKGWCPTPNEMKDFLIDFYKIPKEVDVYVIAHTSGAEWSCVEPRPGEMLSHSTFGRPKAPMGMKRSLFFNNEYKTRWFRFRDTFQFQPGSLEKLGGSIGFEKLTELKHHKDGGKLGAWKGRMHELYEHSPRDFFDYAMRDAEICAIWWKKHFETLDGLGWVSSKEAFTTGGMASRVLREEIVKSGEKEAAKCGYRIQPLKNGGQKLVTLNNIPLHISLALARVLSGKRNREILNALQSNPKGF